MIRGLLACRFCDISHEQRTREKIEIQIKEKRAKGFCREKKEKDGLDFPMTR
jgi:hypothetical protein